MIGIRGQGVGGAEKLEDACVQIEYCSTAIQIIYIAIKLVMLITLWKSEQEKILHASVN